MVENEEFDGLDFAGNYYKCPRCRAYTLASLEGYCKGSIICEKCERTEED